MSASSGDTTSLNWLVESFGERVTGVVDAVIVSSDGLLMAMSAGIGRAGGDQLTAVLGPHPPHRRCRPLLRRGDVEEVVVELQGGYMLFMSIRDGSSLAVLAGKDSDDGLVGYEMTMLAKRVGSVITPALVAELQSALPKA